MDTEIKAKWIEALRSGRYAQARGVLHRLETNPNGDPGYCCLGVLCDIDPRVIETFEDIFARFIYDGDMSGALLPSSYSYLVGLESTDGNTRILDRYGYRLTLAELNDTGFTFDQIADVIEWAF